MSFDRLLKHHTCKNTTVPKNRLKGKNMYKKANIIAVTS